MYQVEAILDKKIDKKTKQQWYYIKWDGYNISQSSWQPKSNLHCRQLIEQFEMKAQKNNYAPETKNLIKRNSNERQPQKRLTRSGRPHEIFNLEENPSPLLGEMSLNKRKNEDNNHFFKEELGKEKEKGQITISGLQRSENGYLFCVKTQNRKEWIEHGWVKDNFPKQLCSFYEKFLVFENP